MTDYQRPHTKTQKFYINGTEVTSTAAELNILDGVTSTATELNILDGVTSTTAELNILDGVTADKDEINVLDGVTAGTAAASKAVVLDANAAVDAVKTQALHIGASGSETEVTATGAELNILDGVTATYTELNTVDLSAVGAITKVKKLSVTTTPTGSEEDTTWDLPAKAFVMDCIVDVTTAESTGATKTLDVGTDGSGSNDPNGFIAAIDVSTTGLKRPEATVTAGSNETYFSANTRGALIADFLAGTDAATDVGTYREKTDVTSGGESITYTAGSADWNEFRGDIYLFYIELG
jgi:hypothetical protein